MLGGKVLVGKWTRLACERHLNDIKTAHKRGLKFDDEEARHVEEYFRFLRHSKGEWAGKEFDLAPWQKWFIWVLFGWKSKSTGLRRFRTAYLTVARKNGKTTLASGISLYMLDGDDEPGAEIYSAATKRDQASIAWRGAQRMVNASSSLKKRIVPYRDELRVEKTNSSFTPLGSDADTVDGLNVHFVLCDELHAWKQRLLWDVLDTATGSRRQPLLLGITTRGFDQQTLCGDLDSYTRKVLEGVIENDAWFGVIYSLDEGDDWEDEKMWPKANPNLGVSVKVDDLLRKRDQAIEITTRQGAFRRLHCNLWTQAATTWIDAKVWSENQEPLDIDSLAGRTCFGGLDLSSTRDTSAWVLLFPPEDQDGRYVILSRVFIPEGNVKEAERRDRAPYSTWAKQGYLTLTGQNAIDYDFIIDRIQKDRELYDLREIAFDRYGVQPIVNRLENEKFNLVSFGQGYLSMSPPTKELERLALQRRLNHLGNPVLLWMMANVMIRKDPAENIKCDKSRSTGRIDAVVALIMALGRATVAMPEQAGGYNQAARKISELEERIAEFEQLAKNENRGPTVDESAAIAQLRSQITQFEDSFL